MSPPLVSVIIPTYNRAAPLLEAIASVQAQTYPRVQLIVVDDGSTDETAARASSIPGVEFCAERHAGHGAARNRGLRLAKGEYIASLDADDLWDADFLERSVGALEHCDVDFVFSNWCKVRDAALLPSEWLTGRTWVPRQTVQAGDWWILDPVKTRELFLDINPAPSSSLLVRRGSIASGWSERLRVANDWYLILEMAVRRSSRGAFCMTPLWRKRVDGLNIYDGRPAVDAIADLYLHDWRIIRRQLATHLSARERFMLARREWHFRGYVAVHRAFQSRLADRLHLQSLASTLRPVARWFAP
jgi:glycosyltransferase involved in cell wall biosynthesis